MVTVSKRNWTRGIFSPVVQSRRDIDAWAAGAKRLQNVTIMKFGGVTKRLGSVFVYKLPDDDKETRMLPFTFSTGQSYALLFGNGTMKPITNGGAVVEDGFGITSITQANPAVVTAPFHNMLDGSELFLNGIEGMTELNGRIVTVAVIDANKFSIGIDTSDFTAFTGDDGTVRTAAPPPPVPLVVQPVTPPEEEPVTTPAFSFNFFGFNF